MNSIKSAKSTCTHLHVCNDERMAFTKLAAALSISCLPLLVACGSADDGTSPEGVDSTESDVNSATPIGKGDGSVSSVTFTNIVKYQASRRPTDLAFNPLVPGQLWVVNYGDDTVAILEGVGGSGKVTGELRLDPAATHFMHHPPALAFGEKNTWAACGDGDNGGNYFMGPSLFSSDLDIFAEATPTGLGSHLDMLHSTSFCRGITHVGGNEYFAFNAMKGSIDLYDFHKDHGPGNDDHSDGTIYRYLDGEVAGVNGAMSHLYYDKASRMLYIADSGNQRVLVMDPSTGTKGQAFAGNEYIVDRRYVNNAKFAEVVPPGTLSIPSGIKLYKGVLYVTDTATSRFYAFDPKTGKVIRTLDTGLPKGALAGFTFGTDGKVYFTDSKNGAVVRIDPK